MIILTAYYCYCEEIMRQINVVSQSIVSRISDLDVWNSANIGLRSDQVLLCY